MFMQRWQLRVIGWNEQKQTETEKFPKQRHTIATGEKSTKLEACDGRMRATRMGRNPRTPRGTVRRPTVTVGGCYSRSPSGEMLITSFPTATGV